ncbi:MAG: TolC family protein [Cystobacter sp.]
MRVRGWAVAVGVWTSVCGGAAWAAAPGEARDPGYCAFVRGVGDAEAAVMAAPLAFANVGVVNAGDTGDGNSMPLGQPTPRVTLGLDYDVVGLVRSRAVRRRADAECSRYQALLGLRVILKQGLDVGAESALAARARVLAEALPKAEAILTALRADVQVGRATLEDLNVLQLRLDALRALSLETTRERERLASLPRREGRSLAAWMETLRAADDEVESQEARLRVSSAWSVRVRGGYDDLPLVQQTVPFSGALTVSYNLGGLWQAPANARARDGRRRSLDEDVEGMSQEVARLLRELRVAYSTEQTRLQGVSALVKDLEGQVRDIEVMEAPRVRRYRDYLQLELTRLRVERAGLQAHVEEIGRFLEEERP